MHKDPSSVFRSPLAPLRVARIGPSPRALREHIPIVRTQRAKGSSGQRHHFFCIPLRQMVLGHAVAQGVPGDFKEPAGFGDVPA